LLLLGAPQSDPGSHFYLGIRKTHLVPGYVYFSDDYQSLLMETRPQIPLYKAGGEKNVILVVYDRLSKMEYFVIKTEGTSVEGLARLFSDNI